MQVLGISSTSPGYQRQPLVKITPAERAYRQFTLEEQEHQGEYSPNLLSDGTLDALQHTLEDLEESTPLEPAKAIVNDDGSVNLVPYRQLLISSHLPYPAAHSENPHLLNMQA